MPAAGDVLLDTTVVVAHLRGVAAVSQRLAETQTRYLSTMALGELHYGVRRSTRQEENLRQLERWLRVAVLLPGQSHHRDALWPVEGSTGPRRNADPGERSLDCGRRGENEQGSGCGN